MTFTAALILLAISSVDGAPATLTFAEAVSIARDAAPAAVTGVSTESIRGWRLPDMRLETTGNTTRMLDPLTANPLQTDGISTVLAADYPLWDGGARRARLDALDERVRRLERNGLDARRFEALVEAFGDLYLAQQQEQRFAPLHERLAEEAERASRLLRSGELSNLEASHRRTLASGAASQLLELRLRREDAAARLSGILGLETEPQLVLALDGNEVAAPRRSNVFRSASEEAVAQSRAQVRAAGTASQFTAMLSGFAGATAARSDFNDVSSSGTFGIYGLRIHLSYPLFRSASIAAAEARLALIESERVRDAEAAATRERSGALRRHAESLERRVELLLEQIEESRLTAASLERLAAAGLQSGADVVAAQLEVARREAELLGAQVARWKTMQRLAWLDQPEQSRP